MLQVFHLSERKKKHGMIPFTPCHRHCHCPHDEGKSNKQGDTHTHTHTPHEGKEGKSIVFPVDPLVKGANHRQRDQQGEERQAAHHHLFEE